MKMISQSAISRVFTIFWIVSADFDDISVHLLPESPELWPFLRSLSRRGANKIVGHGIS